MNDVAENVLKLAKEKGIEQAEVFLIDSQELSIEVVAQEVENLHIAKDRGMGLRLICGNRMGYAYSSDFSEPALAGTVERAFQNARLTVEDSAWALATTEIDGLKRNVDLNIFDEEITTRSLQEKMELAKKLELAVLHSDRRIRQAEKAIYQDSTYRVGIFNSFGLASKYRGSYCGLYGVAIGQEGEDAETGWAMHYSLHYRELNPQKVGEKAGKRAVRMLGAQSMPSGKMSVVFEPYTMTGLLGVLKTAFSGEAVLKGKSFFAGREGQLIANSLVNIFDHGALQNHIGSAPFDYEGVPTGETVLVKEGYLHGYLHNLYTAQKHGVSSTGNAVRSSYKSTPEVGTTNFYIDKGNMTPEQLCKVIEQGLYVTDIMGLHTVNPITGDFSLGASGLLIERGELTKPVKGLAIAGNLRDLLQNVIAIADDLTFFIGKGAPTVGVEGIRISGN